MKQILPSMSSERNRQWIEVLMIFQRNHSSLFTRSTSSQNKTRRKSSSKKIFKKTTKLMTWRKFKRMLRKITLKLQTLISISAANPKAEVNTIKQVVGMKKGSMRRMNLIGSLRDMMKMIHTEKSYLIECSEISWPQDSMLYSWTFHQMRNRKWSWTKSTIEK